MTSSHHLQEELRWQVVGRTEDVMKRLVSRYIHQTKKQLRQDGVNEDDLLEIKQDISSLRYELREDRKRETARNTGQIDSIKRDIIRSLRGNQYLQDLPQPHELCWCDDASGVG
ncbi:transient-receptor-potential-like protein [Caerostris extrusa]|uniref:Transient-receptor-potential-like protein n=1 Tax=Caerostris extrusa TaxID=172846 RepID=A0AAV4UFD1_CAEEX|nr:transient-receptor-potential-like protein [Caerostris extrusa]